jgi:hypothetical protein
MPVLKDLTGANGRKYLILKNADGSSLSLNELLLKIQPFVNAQQFARIKSIALSSDVPQTSDVPQAKGKVQSPQALQQQEQVRQSNAKAIRDNPSNNITSKVVKGLYTDFKRSQNGVHMVNIQKAIECTPTSLYDTLFDLYKISEELQMNYFDIHNCDDINKTNILKMANTEFSFVEKDSRTGKDITYKDTILKCVEGANNLLSLKFSPFLDYAK